MRLMSSFLALCVLAVLPALSGCATKLPDHYVELIAWRGEVVTTLRQQRDPYSMVAVALFPAALTDLEFYKDPIIIGSLDAAAAARPDDAAIAALRLMACLALPDCDHARAAEALGRVDPGNGIALWSHLRSEFESADERRIDAALVQLARSSSFNVHQNANIVAAVQSLRSTALPPPPQEPDIDAASALGLEMLGNYTGYALRMLSGAPSVLEACRYSEAATDRHRMCLQILSTMMASDAEILQMLGASLTCRIASPGSADLDQARAAFRRVDWTSESLLGAIQRMAQEGQTEALQRYLDLELEMMSRHAREEDSRRALVAALGLAVDPPDDWQSKRRLKVGNCGPD